jgi:hypothetical protein
MGWAGRDAAGTRYQIKRLRVVAKANRPDAMTLSITAEPDFGVVIWSRFGKLGRTVAEQDA